MDTTSLLIGVALGVVLGVAGYTLYFPLDVWYTNKQRQRRSERYMQ